MTTLTSEDVAELLRLHMEHGVTWEQLAADEGCDAASLEDAARRWEPGGRIEIKRGAARLRTPQGRLDLDVLSAEVESGATDEEIADRHKVSVALVGERRRELGLHAAGVDRSIPRHLRLLDQVEAALRRLTTPASADEIAQEAGVTAVSTVRLTLAELERQGRAVCTHRPRISRDGATRWAAEGEPAPATPAPVPEPEGPYAYMKGDSGEVMRGCIELRKKIKEHMDAQVRRPAEIPCAACRRPTPIPELRGRPGRLICTACEAPAPAPQPEPNPGAQAPQPEESTMPTTTREEREERRQRVLELRREGLTHAQIAERLSAAQSTINSDLRALAEAGEELPPNLTPPGRQPDEEMHGTIRELIAQGVAHGEIVRQTGASRAMVSRVIREARGLDPYPSTRGKGDLQAEIERLRATLRETEEGAAELLEELERLRSTPTASSQIAALKEGVAVVERERLDLARQLVEAQTAHTLALIAAEDLRRAAEAQAVDARAALASAQREIDDLRAQLAAAEEAARRPPEARRAEVERLELELAALREEHAAAQRRASETWLEANVLREEVGELRYQLDSNPWRRAWELRRRLRQASQEERTAEALLGAAREARIEAADELEAIEAALEATP